MAGGKDRTPGTFLPGETVCLLVADQVPEPILRANFSKAINDVIFGVGQVSVIYNTWDDLLNTLANQAQSERLVVVIDELPFGCCGPVPGIDPVEDVGPDLKNTQIMLDECRRSRRPLGVDILEQLEAKSRALVKEVDGRTLLPGL